MTGGPPVGHVPTARTEPAVPLVSVVLPTYQRADVLGRAMRSVLAQTVTDLELLVVDDGSTDGTAELVADIARTDPRVRYLVQPNGGAPRARNRGVAHARAPYTAFQDSDDEWEPTFLERLLPVVRSRPDVLAFTSHDVTHLDGRVVRLPAAHVPDVRRRILHRNLVSTQTVLLPTALLRDVGGFDVHLRSVQDWELWLRLHGRVEFVHVDEVLVHLHRQADSISETAGYRRSLRRVVRRHWRLLATEPGALRHAVRRATIGSRPLPTPWRALAPRRHAVEAP
ncbi:glycosyltransferase family 2 protein [Cellulomonas iranensis]|uniref:glycosyltransferase family 2 protein n=1 Tax=Cellulomonas iranensis TaxID=76862 RepID=UPI001CF202BD|nr:glycosyltransferase family A protein [Cellulomonas iranensis]UCN14087.1 glycosyltransferase family 2 protein [Cellulomonas iranensis]